MNKCEHETDSSIMVCIPCFDADLALKRELVAALRFCHGECNNCKDGDECQMDDLITRAEASNG